MKNLNFEIEVDLFKKDGDYILHDDLKFYANEFLEKEETIEAYINQIVDSIKNYIDTLGHIPMIGHAIMTEDCEIFMVVGVYYSKIHGISTLSFKLDPFYHMRPNYNLEAGLNRTLVV